MSDPLRVAVLGLDARAQNLFRMFFRGPCQNRATIVDNEQDAEAFLIDLDLHQGARLLDTQKKEHPDRVFLVLSLKELEPVEGAVFVKKPAQAQGMLTAIDNVRALLAARRRRAELRASRPAPEPAPASPSPRQAAAKPARSKPAGQAAPTVEGPLKTIAATRKSEPPSAHRVAMLLDEQSFKSYLGHREDIDPKNPSQLAALFYDPKEFLQGHIQAACKVAVARDQALRMETPWKSVSILPQQYLVHIQADEAQLRAACGIPFRNIVGVDIDAPGREQAVKLKPLSESEVEAIMQSGEAVRVDTFLWKVALLTSKGKIPRGIDLEQPVSLKHWPNMTRLLLPPNAMRIAAVLHQKPRGLFETARVLGIRQQYVFAFFSAAQALGLVAQHAAETRIETPPQPPAETAPPQPQRTSLLRKILNRLKFT
jgi:hypothetical protein